MNELLALHTLLTFFKGFKGNDSTAAAPGKHFAFSFCLIIIISLEGCLAKARIRFE
jgi:hypothetical protein